MLIGTSVTPPRGVDHMRVRDKLLFRLPGALVRAVLVVILIGLPAALVPGRSSDGTQVIVLIAIFAALFTLVEYSASSPSLVEFRDAPPFNRVRFCALFATVLSLSIIFRGYVAPSTLTDFFQMSGAQIGRMIDFPYSPVRLMVSIMPPSATAQYVETMRDAAGFSYLLSLLSIIWFMILLRLQQWPPRGGSFNVWINLPTFDPTSGGDVVKRLRRDGWINIILGFLLPFLVPAMVKFSGYLGAPIRLDDPHTMIWTVTAWAFLPAGILMRGIALTRVARMIHQQRQKASKKAAADRLLPA